MNTSSLGEHVKKYLWVIIVGPARRQVKAGGGLLTERWEVLCRAEKDPCLND